MKTAAKILINTLDKAQEFQKSMEKLKSDVDLGTDRYIVNAKSIMGVLSIDITKPLVVEIISGDQEEIDLFNELIKKYRIKEE